jgi:hypothetical protein
MLQERDSCQTEVLLSTREGVICRCRCGIYHVRIGTVTLHLTAPQFEETARLFKISLGMAVGRRLSASRFEPILDISESEHKESTVRRVNFKMGFPRKENI